MRGRLTRKGLDGLMDALARSAPGRRRFRVYFVGGGTAVAYGWRDSTIDADLYSDDDRVFGDLQGIKERLDINVEFARPEDFVPALAGTEDRHVFIKTVGTVSFYHYDPYAQLLSKIVRGFGRDMEDARQFIATGMVESQRFSSLVRDVPVKAYARYPALSRKAVLDAVERFLSEIA